MTRRDPRRPAIPKPYARLLMLHHEKWDGVFETRTSARHRGRREAAGAEVHR